MIDPQALSPWLFLLAPVVVIVAYTVFGLSGFGSTVISVPLLAHFLPVTYLVPLMALLDMVCAAVIGTTNRRHVAKDELKFVLPFMFVGFVAGLTLLVKVPDQYLRVALGIFAAVVGIHGMVSPVLHRTISRLWCVPVGIVGGALATVFGAGGPLYAVYFSGRLKDKDQIRSTVSTMISISAFSRVVLYAIGGLLLHWTLFAGMVALAPFVLIGVRLGSRIHVGLTLTQMRRVVGAVLIASGASLLARAFL